MKMDGWMTFSKNKTFLMKFSISVAGDPQQRRLFSIEVVYIRIYLARNLEKPDWWGIPYRTGQDLTEDHS